ncbi:uncharacterized protein [Aquarana catesbeiana]|uniref:uncharacterized protein n=1 Tax=Aquarana catesbeiana TaxID=8400 RepID=UPI003CC9F2C7
MAALAFLFQLAGYGDFTKSFVVRRELRGYWKGSSKPDSRRPVSFEVLGIILENLKKVCSWAYEQVLFRTAFVLAFFGAFRIVADWCSGLHAESILTPGLPITGMSMNEAEKDVVSSQLKPAGETCDFETHCSWTSSTSRNEKPHWVRTLVGELSLQDQIQLLNKSRSLDDGILLLNTSLFSESCIETQLLSPLYSRSSGTCQLEMMFYSQDESLAQKLKVMMQDKKSNLTIELPPFRQEEASQW